MKSKKQPEQTISTFKVIMAANVESVIDSNSPKINLKADYKEIHFLQECTNYGLSCNAPQTPRGLILIVGL